MTKKSKKSKANLKQVFASIARSGKRIKLDNKQICRHIYR